MDTAVAAPVSGQAGRPWRRAALSLVLLGVLFYASYGFSNWLAAQRSDVGSIVFDWEHHVPFLAWTILPYWSINVFYALSPFLCASQRELDRHVRQLLTVQLIAVTCFIVFPLRVTFPKPEVDGLPGFMFAVLGGFDMPFNQAPSLHIALAVVLAAFYGRKVGPRWAPWIYGWFIVVGASVLTTYQHHFIDIPTGVLLGLVAMWLWPQEGESPLAGATVTTDTKRRRLASFYGIGALAFVGIAWLAGGMGLWLLWVSIALCLVALCYLAIGPAGFQKHATGRHGFAAGLLLLPYRIGAWVNSRLWTRREPAFAEIADGVWIGRMPRGRERAALPATQIVDLCAELPAPAGLRAYCGIPALDLVPLAAGDVQRAAEAIEELRSTGPVLVVCALGYGRSAAAIAAWLVRSGRAADLDQALAIIRKSRPRITLDVAALNRALGTPSQPLLAAGVS